MSGPRIREISRSDTTSWVLAAFFPVCRISQIRSSFLRMIFDEREGVELGAEMEEGFDLLAVGARHLGEPVERGPGLCRIVGPSATPCARSG